MKKTSKKASTKSPISLRNILLALLGLLTVVVAWRVIVLSSAVTGKHPLSFADNRHVENVQCSGACEGVLLVSDQQPDVQYYVGVKDSTCSEAILWANTNGREDQIVFGGHQFIDGYQKNLSTQTLSLDVLSGTDIEFTLPDSGSMFKAHVKDAGEWNILDSVECNQRSCSGFTRVFTDRDSGRVKLYDSCPSSSTATDIYALYQAPEVHGPDTEDTYLVGISLRALPSTGSTTGSVEGAGFEQIYTSSELAANSIHVSANVGDATFDFDLVKHAK